MKPDRFFLDENGLEKTCAGSGQNGLRWEAVCHLEQEINGSRCMFMHSLPVKMSLYSTTVLQEETGTAKVLRWITSSIKAITSCVLRHQDDKMANEKWQKRPTEIITVQYGSVKQVCVWGNTGPNP